MLGSILLHLVALTWMGSSGIEEPDVARPVERLESLLEKAHARGALYGNVLVVEKGMVVLERSYGLADDTTGEEVTADSLFEIASITKPITAVALLELVEREELELDNQVTEILPEFPYPGVTIRHLLTHTSGLINHRRLFGISIGRIEPGQVVTNDDLMALLIEEAPEPASEPGEAFAYSNTNYLVLAEVIETVSGQPFAEFVESEVFEPAGMTTAQVLTTRYTEGAPNLPNLTESYVPGKGGAWVPVTEANPIQWKFVTVFSGIEGPIGIVCRARDLLALHEALRDGKLLEPETLAEAYRRLTLNDGSTVEDAGWMPSSYGLGWYLMPDGQGVWHTGDWGGYLTGFFRDLERDRVLIYLQNRSRYDFSWIPGALQILEADGPLAP